MSQEDKEKAISMRDRLNKMVEETMAGSPDMEDHVVACCLSVAVEELEKWIYTNDWTPSVRPYIDDREFEIPYPSGSEKDSSQTGPPWNRRKVAIEDRFPTVARLKKQGKLKGQAQRVRLENLDTHHWTSTTMNAFREGDRGAFIRILRNALGYPISIRKISEYLDEQIKANDFLWGIDKKPGDKCPKCGSDHIDHSDLHVYPNECCECRTCWGIILPF